MSVLTNIKAKETEDKPIAVTDNLNGFIDTIKTIFLNSVTQICVVHQIKVLKNKQCLLDNGGVIFKLTFIYI